ncbi:MAG: 23S rRNA (adenine(2503)-C(2))-methyltransferase RlmN [Chitinophagales bacterium]|nr:23S rRNA (adenine(2503)-C(2))-methyltransferase RlmN [Bacteroidota bacterium]MCB9042726.1 23S rRNA (adenine(2503)-C(2))-methyltransferase RlmN [Chitinophagales bacterium]
MNPTNTSAKPDIRQLTQEELQNYFLSKNEPAFRAKQLYQWLWQKGSKDFSQMTNLSQNLRQQLSEDFTLQTLQLNLLQKSEDETIKCRFALHDHYMVEGVIIPTAERTTACVSSQVGCSLSCSFCATGKMKRMRNLAASEIFDQVISLNELSQKHFQKNLNNIVFMGMGEPLLNYNNTLLAIEKLTQPNALGMSPRRITVSTAGVAKMIYRLADDNPKVNLALSLHAANDAKRSEIMPINEQNNLESLREALQYFQNKNGRLLYFEYIMFKNFNDSLQDAKELVRFCRNFPCKVNLIEYNTVEGTGMHKSEEDALFAFQQYLQAKNITCTLRRSRGKDIDAACGQLANKN